MPRFGVLQKWLLGELGGREIGGVRNGPLIDGQMCYMANSQAVPTERPCMVIMLGCKVSPPEWSVFIGQTVYMVNELSNENGPYIRALFHITYLTIDRMTYPIVTVHKSQPTDHGQEGGDGGLRGERGVLQDGFGARLDGGDGEAGRPVLGVDRLQRLVQPADLGEDVLGRRRVGRGGGTVGERRGQGAIAV